MSLITLQATCRFTFNTSGYIFPYVDSVYYTVIFYFGTNTKSMNLGIHELVIFNKTTKIDTNEEKYFHSGTPFIVL
jgi:hypothetical protein